MSESSVTKIVNRIVDLEIQYLQLRQEAKEIHKHGKYNHMALDRLDIINHRSPYLKTEVKNLLKTLQVKEVDT